MTQNTASKCKTHPIYGPRQSPPQKNVKESFCLKMSIITVKQVKKQPRWSVLTQNSEKGVHRHYFFAMCLK